jgi:hypothetical protein
MASLATHKANRAAAGAAYAAAAAAYLAAWIELKAQDMTVENATVGGGAQASFGEQPQIAGHGEFLRDRSTLTRDIPDRVNARHQQLLAS